MRPTHPSSPGDTPVFNDPAVIAAMVDDYVGIKRRKFPSAEMLRSAASMLPGLPADVRASRLWSEVVDEDAGQFVLPGQEAFEVYQDQPLTEGPQWNISISPGRVRVWTRDEARDDRRQVHELELRAKAADALATFLEEDENGELVDCIPEDPAPSREVTRWSAKSRSNMIGSFGDLDYTVMFEDPLRLSAMVTLTYPRCWQRVAPNGKAAKKHLKAWRKRWEREFGETLRCIWKQEFQGRAEFKWVKGARVDNWCRCETCAELEDGRAPHFHLLVTIPRTRLQRDDRDRIVRDQAGHPVHESITTDDFKAWVSRSWADVVDHPDPVEYAAHLSAGTRVDTEEGRRAADPRRVTTYFAKHGSAKAKEYQHVVPLAWRGPGDGPGRFWGYWGLEKRVVTVQVDPATGHDAGRVVRRHSRAQGVTRLTMRRRYKGGRADSKYPEVIGLAGKLLMEAHRLTHRPCRTRAVRAQNGRGWLLVNDGANMGASLGRALQISAEYRLEQAEELLNPHDPLVRAYRLAPGPRRDALLAKLQARAA